MRRRVVIILLLLFGGAIVNVAIAWACARWTTIEQIDDVDRQIAQSLLMERGFNPAPDDNVECRGGSALGLTIQSLKLGAEPNGENNRNSFWGFLYEAGYPFRSVSAEFRGEGVDLDEIIRNLHVVGGINTKSFYTQSIPRILPLQPIWPGFAINTIFYAAILWGLFSVPLALRRRRRMQRGLCPACAYPWGVGTSPVCTECGGPVGKRPNVKTSKRPNEDLTPSA